MPDGLHNRELGGIKNQPERKAVKGRAAYRAEPDKQGRIAIAPALRAYANITGEVVVVGLVDRAEIWDKAAWEEYTNSTPLEDIAGMAEELGI